MKYRMLLIAFCLTGARCLAQDYLDRLWLVGYNEFPGMPGSGNAQIRFTNDTVTVEPVDLHLNFESTMAVGVGEQGNLLFYTNGCTINNAEGQPMPNGEGLNPGSIFDMACPATGYISPRGATALPAPGNPDLYYLIHMGVRYDPVKHINYGPLYYSVIDMNQNDGKGDVVSKNNVLADGQLEPYDLVRHGNGRDWWLVAPEYATNRYHIFLISPTGITEQTVQEVGTAPGCQRIGSTAFSQNGRRFVRYQNCRAEVFDFDRCSGQLSLYRSVAPPAPLFSSGGVFLSPDGTSLFFASQYVLFQTDLLQDPAIPDTAFILNYDWGANIHLMQYGPDGHLYLNLMNRGTYLNAIANPQAAFGQAIDFRFSDISLPVTNVRTLPHFPNFRLYDWGNSACDTLGISQTQEEEFIQDINGLSIFPNPTTNRIYLTLTEPDVELLSVRLLDAQGQVIEHIRYPRAGWRICVLDLGAQPAGVYVVQVRTGLGWAIRKVVKL